MDDNSTRFIVKIIIPIIIIICCWIYGFIKGLLEKDDDNSNPIKNIQYYSKKIKSDADNYEHYFQRANAYRQIGNYNKAIEDLTKVIDLNPNHWNAYSTRSVCYYFIGQKQTAFEDAAKAIELNPEGEAILYYNRALLNYEFQNTDEAILDLNKSLEIDSNNEDSLSLYGRIKYELEKKNSV